MSCVLRLLGDPFVAISNPSVVGQFVKQMYAQYHDQQSDGNDDQQHKSKPSQHHGSCAHPGSNAAVSEVLRNRCGRHRGCVLPQYRYEHED